MPKIPTRYSFGWPFYRKEFVLQKDGCVYTLKGHESISTCQLQINVQREARSLQQALQ